MIEFTVSLRLRFSERNVDNVSRTRELVKQAYKIELCSLPNEARGDYARLLFNGIKILNCLRKKKAGKENWIWWFGSVTRGAN